MTMARNVRRKLAWLSVSLLLPVVRAWPLRASGRDLPQTSPKIGHGLLLRVAVSRRQGRQYGLEIHPQSPYVRLLKLTLAPVSVPLAAGSYVGRMPRMAGVAGGMQSGQTCPNNTGGALPPTSTAGKTIHDCFATGGCTVTRPPVSCNSHASCSATTHTIGGGGTTTGYGKHCSTHTTFWCC